MRKNTTGQVVAFQAVSTTDGSAVTTGTPVVYYTIDGGTQGTGAGTSTHEGNGCWTYAPLQAETNGNHVVFTFALAGAVSQSVNLYPVSFDPTDSVRIGLTALPNATAGAAGGLPTDSTGKTAFNDLDATGVRSAVGLASADLDTQLGDLPSVAEFEARTLVSSAYFDAAADTVTVGASNDKTGYALSSTSRDAIVADFLAHVITKGSAGTIERAFWQAAKSQSSAEGEVSGTPTASAFDTNLTAVTGAFDDLLLLFVSGSLAGEARPIATYNNTSGRITLQESLTAAPSAADEFLIVPSHTHPIADIQSGLATSAALATVDGLVDLLVSRSGYQMSILAGAISNAQDAAEAYSITLDGNTYSVTYSGLDASGNRSGATLVTT